MQLTNDSRVSTTGKKIENIAASRTRLRWRESYDLLLLIGLTLLLPGLVLTPVTPLRVIFGLAIVLFGPGYALVEALFPARTSLDGLARAGASFGLSVATLPLLALILNSLPWGIRLWPMVISLMVWIILFSLAALARRWFQMPLDRVQAPDLAGLNPVGWWRSLTVGLKLALCLGVVTLSGLIIYGSIIFLSPNPADQMTEFYALGAEGLAQSYPREVKPGQPMQVQLGIINREGSPVTYRIEVRSGDKILAQTDSIRLESGAKWEQPLRYQLATVGNDQKIDIYLYRNLGFSPYRQLQLWVNVVGSPTN